MNISYNEPRNELDLNLIFQQQKTYSNRRVEFAQVHFAQQISIEMFYAKMCTHNCVN